MLLCDVYNDGDDGDEKLDTSVLSIILNFSGTLWAISDVGRNKMILLL